MCFFFNDPATTEIYTLSLHDALPICRGLGVMKADAALITNVAEDHLGDFGSQNLGELLNVKWIVSRAVETSGSLILNADDELLVAKSAEFPGVIVWFTLNPDKIGRAHV